MKEPANNYQRAAELARRDQLVLTHLPLVKHAIGRLAGGLPPGVDLENLEAAGLLGLVEAAARFDPQRNAQFSTFAFLRVRGAIHDELRRNSMFPQEMLDRIASVRRATARRLAPATVAELATETGLTEDEVAETLAAMQISRVASWDELAESASAAADASGESAERHEQEVLLAEAIAALPERKRQVVTLYYRNDMRLKEIGAVIGLSESRVSRLLSAAVFDLRQFVQIRQAETEQVYESARH